MADSHKTGYSAYVPELDCHILPDRSEEHMAAVLLGICAEIDRVDPEHSRRRTS